MYRKRPGCTFPQTRTYHTTCVTVEARCHDQLRILSRTMDTPVDSNLISRTKTCKTCSRNAISSFGPLKNCDDCRRKNRLKTAHRSERKRQRIEFFAQNHGNILGHLSSEDGNTRCKENDVRSGTSLVNSKLLNELNGRVALKRMKESLQMTIKAESRTRPSKIGGKQVISDVSCIQSFVHDAYGKIDG
jgi:hypothetical protein